MKEEKEKRIWYLLSLSLSGEATPEEGAELEAMLRQYPDEGFRVQILQNIWKNCPQESATPPAGFDKHLQRLSTHLSEPVLQFETTEANTHDADEERWILDDKPRATRRRWLWAAGMAASLLIAFLIFYPRSKENRVASNTISTKAGSKTKIQLPDGTQVWLNADSKITYSQDFMGAYREVQLTGEAYFDVVKDKARPFIIHTGPMDVKVIGTSFNVRAYPNETATETALIQGAVEIILHSNPDKKILLKPSEKLTIQNPPSPEMAEQVKNNTPAGEPALTLGKIHYGKTDSTGSIETMWVRNKLAFENETFEHITAEMQRWYNVKFVIKKEELKEVRLRGIFENKSLAEVMEALQLSASFQYQLREGTVTVW